MSCGSGGAVQKQVSRLPVSGNYTRAVEFHQIWVEGPAALQMLRWEGEGDGMCPAWGLGSSLWGTSAWEASHFRILPNCCALCLCLCSLLGFGRKMIMCVGLGGLVGLRRTESSGLQ